ncbi:patatin domain-containing protein [Roseateles sp. DAIF2]|uniref:patatin-like phospholipase family protein n=1 Tax=Roseateles sp. DAIF2 TaxID=2714952 RepID=UPI0018A2B47A|nr:patatin-like phospholipase family protein [Roseateles sp. DAIF2]QPF73216.1 patatin domain-containing protein [Roseateles sp. DAIF2]
MPIRPLIRGALLSLLLVLVPSLTRAQPVEPPPDRPKIGLVLSGGGARGIAHIGVLRTLERLKVPVDIVVGTSMGALVGGAYASGRSVEELQAFVHAADWESILADRPNRRSLSYARREEDQLVPSRIEMGVNRRGATLPPAAAGNSALEYALEQLVSPASADLPSNRLPLPFRALATDLLSGDLQQLEQVPLFLALRASMAVPGVFAPVRVDGRLLVDGGLVRNLGIDVARQLGADIIIAVNAGSPLLEEQELSSAIGVTNQMLQILTEQNVARSLRELRPSDVLIDPQLDSMSFLDFGRREQALEVGERAAMAVQERLAPLALPETQYRQLRLALRQRPAASQPAVAALPLGELRIEGTKRSNPEALKTELGHLLGLKPDAPTTQPQIEKAATALQGRGEFERVDVQSSERADGKRDVTLRVSETDWAFSRLRIGLELYSNFDDANRFSLVATHHASWLNSWGAELRSLLRIGSKRELGAELRQPLGPGSPWYAALRLSSQSSDTDIFGDHNLRVARLAYSNSTSELILGRRLGNWGDVRFGTVDREDLNRLRVPQDPENKPAQQRQGVFGQFRLDSLDSMAFPSRGQLLDARAEILYKRSTGDIGLQYAFVGMSAFQWRSWAGHLYAEFAHASDDDSPRLLGGFLRLSGSPDNSMRGSNLALARLVMAKRIGQMPLGLGHAVRLGFSIETGNVTQRGHPIKSAELRLAGSGFLSIDTRFGPFYLALGHTKDRGGALYLYLGPVF